MHARFVQLMHLLGASFWFLPAVLASMALCAALTSVNFDETAKARVLAAWLPLPSTGIEGARQVVSTIAGSMITVASLVFSLTLVALTLMAQQLGPRIIPIFMTDRVTQIVLGYFVATFLFSLMVLSSIGSGAEGTFVPQISVYVACVFAIAAFGLMIFFVHHIARSIQADAVVANLAETLQQELDRRFKHESGFRHDDTVGPPPVHREDTRNSDLIAPCSGYIQFIDYDTAVRLATKHALAISFNRGPGHFVLEGACIGMIIGDDPGEKCRREICQTVTIGSTRTRPQEVEFEFNALLEVALRALSPGVNDPFTAIACIDHLAAALACVMREPRIERWLIDDDGTRRVRRYMRDFDDYMTLVMHPLRQAAVSSPQVAYNLASALRSLHELSPDSQTAKVVAGHGHLLADDCGGSIENESDRQAILSILGFARSKSSDQLTPL